MKILLGGIDGSSGFGFTGEGDLVLPHEVCRDAAVGVKGGSSPVCTGRGESSGKKGARFSGAPRFPGIVDAHVHSYSIPGVEGFVHSSTSAAAGA